MKIFLIVFVTLALTLALLILYAIWATASIPAYLNNPFNRLVIRKKDGSADIY